MANIVFINIKHIKNHTEEEIEEIIKLKNKIIDKHRKKPEIQNIWFNPRHPGNELFLKVSGIVNLSPEEQEKEIINLFSSLEVNHFCHSEIDSKFRSEVLYCFKREIDLGDKVKIYKDIIDEAQVSKTTELYLKFKIKNYPDQILFAMTYHFPTIGKVEWTYLFRENY